MQMKRGGAVRWVVVIVFLILAGLAATAVWQRQRRNLRAELERQLTLAQGERDGASSAELMRRLLRCDLESGRRLELADALLGLGELEEAAQVAEAALTEDATLKARVLRLRARVALAKGMTEQGLALMEASLGCQSGKPERVAALDEVTGLLLGLGRQEEALRRATERIQLKDTPEGRLMRARIEILLGLWDEAAADFALLRERASGEAMVRDLLPAWERVERGLGELRRLDVLVAKDLGAARPRLERALLLLRLGLWERARAELQRAHEGDRAGLCPAVMLAGIHEELEPEEGKRVPRAERAATPWLASTAELGPWGELGGRRLQAWLDLIAADESLRIASQSERPLPDWVEQAAARAGLVLELGYAGAAEQLCAELLQKCPTNVTAQRLQIQALLALGREASAAETLKQALASAEREKREPDAEFQGVAGLVLQARGRHEEAVKAFTLRLEGGKTTEFLRARARSLRFLQRFEEAATDLEAARQLGELEPEAAGTDWASETRRIREFDTGRGEREKPAGLFRVELAESWRWSWHEHALPARPELVLFFSEPVAAEDVAATVFWRDGAGSPVASEVRIDPRTDPKSARRFEVSPRRPLAAGATIELLVEGTRSALDGKPLAYVHAFRVGETKALELESVAGYHQPREGAFVELRFSQSMDPEGVKPAQLRITPEVPGTRLVVDGCAVRVHGDFKVGTAYQVQVEAGVRSRLGFSLEKAESWKARFHDKRAALMFPRSVVTTTAREGLRLEFTQVNTGELEWRLASVPAESLAEVRSRLREYLQLSEVRDPAAGEYKQVQTRLLVESLRLPVLKEGRLEASRGNAELARKVELSAGEMEEGVYLFEISGQTMDGRLAGNRVLVFVNREMLVWKTMPTGLESRLVDVVSGQPVGGAKLTLLGDEGRLIGEGRTDAAGRFMLPRAEEDWAPRLVLVRRDGHLSAHHLETPWGFGSGYRHYPREDDDESATGKAKARQWLFTDRGIYRPGETVHVKGLVRNFAEGSLGLLPVDTPVSWELLREGREEPVLTGTTSLSASGAWEAELSLPANIPVGHYSLAALGSRCAVKVDEFRAPPFAAELQSADGAAGKGCAVRVVSHLYSGAPNAGAAVRWRVEWRAHLPELEEAYRPEEPWLVTSDYESPDSPYQKRRQQRYSEEDYRRETGWSLQEEGTAQLGADGTAVLVCKAPAASGRRLAAAEARWEVTVLAADGQAVETERVEIAPLAGAQPALALSNGKGAGIVHVLATALDPGGKAVAGQRLRLELLRVEEKSVRENLSRHVVRYRNTPVYELVTTKELQSPFEGDIKVEGTGRLVAVLTLEGSADAPRASSDITLCGSEPAEFAQLDDQSFAMRTELPDYRVGSRARVALRAPFAGQAWVTVESDRILHSEFVSLSGNAAEVEVPVTKDMYPSAQVVVYLFRPQGAGALAERLAKCTLKVRRPETELQVEPKLLRERVEPGQELDGQALVLCEGKPVPGAELCLFAVDESVLRYGRWSLPEPGPLFFPETPHAVVTRSGLRQFKLPEADEPRFQKGFLIGDGARGAGRFRRNFSALAFWQGVARSDADGRVSFHFRAPDNLTAYRIVAVAQAGTEQFGQASRLVEVARQLQLEPALPRFVREGDEVELRVLVRQGALPLMKGRLECQVTHATLLEAGSRSLELRQGLPQALGFRVRVERGAAPMVVRFSAQAGQGGPADAVELALPVKPARVLREAARVGELAGSTWVPPEEVTKDWIRAEGTTDLVVSSSPRLALLDGLPRLLEYPHGCNEQISGRVLAYCLMAGFLASLPDGELRKPEYRRRVEAGLAVLARAQLPGGEMPYWSGQKEANPFVTIQSAWAVLEAERSGFRVSQRLVTGLREALERMVRRQQGVRVSANLRAFALFASASLEPGKALRGEAIDLWQKRDLLDAEGRAFLVLALQRWGLMPEERRRLLAEAGSSSLERAFDAATFGSEGRAEALQLWARAEVAGRSLDAVERAALTMGLDRLMKGSTEFSTQENLWSLLALQALARLEPALRLEPIPTPENGALLSKDGTAAGWYSLPIFRYPEALVGLPADTAQSRHYLVRARYRLAEPEQTEDRGFCIERVVTNLTDSRRTGTETAPFALGDELVLTFRVSAKQAQAYVSLEDLLPAAFETLDPEYLRLTLRDRLADSSEGFGSSLGLSHWERRDDCTRWYFDQVAPGQFTYRVIVRVTSPGRFQWPGAVIAPMYDARFGGLSEARTIHVR